MTTRAPYKKFGANDANDPLYTIGSYTPREIAHFSLVEFFATTFAIMLMAGPASLGSLIGYTGSNFTSINGLFTIFLIGLTNFAGLYGAHATYIKHKAGYVNIFIAALYVIPGEWKEKRWGVFFKLGIMMTMEIIGCVCAALLLWGLLGDNGTNLGKPEIGPGIPWQRAFGVEIFFTFVLLVISATSMDPLTSGIVLVAMVVVGVPISGASLNWVRHFGSTLVSNSFAPIDWIYYVGPFIGFAGAIPFIAIYNMFSPESK